MSLTVDRFLPGTAFYGWRTIAGTCLVLVVVLGSEIFKRADNQGVPYKTGISFFNAWKFFTKRHSFLVKAMEESGPIFSFNVLQASFIWRAPSSRKPWWRFWLIVCFQHKVVTVTGEKARRIFYGDKDLNLAEGYKVLFGGVSLHFNYSLTWWAESCTIRLQCWTTSRLNMK